MRIMGLMFPDAVMALVDLFLSKSLFFIMGQLSFTLIGKYTGYGCGYIVPDVNFCFALEVPRPVVDLS